MSTASDRFVVLRGGLMVPLEPMLLLLDLEARGFRIARDGSTIKVGPASQLTDDDRDALKRWKPHVLALVDYQPEVVQ